MSAINLGQSIPAKHKTRGQLEKYLCDETRGGKTCDEKKYTLRGITYSYDGLLDTVAPGDEGSARVRDEFHPAATKTAAGGRGRAAANGNGKKTGPKKGGETGEAQATHALSIPPDLGAIRRELADIQDRAMKALAEGRRRAARFLGSLRSIEAFASYLLTQVADHDLLRRVLGPSAIIIGLEASLGAKGAVERYANKAETKGDKAREAFIAAQPSMQFEIDSFQQLAAAAARFFETTAQIFYQADQNILDIHRQVYSPNPQGQTFQA